jgi:hypothetical protein
MYIEYDMYCVYELIIIVGLCLFSRLNCYYQMAWFPVVAIYCLDVACYSEFAHHFQLLAYWSFCWLHVRWCILVVCSVLPANVVVLCNFMWYSSYRFPSYGFVLIFGITIPCSFVMFVFLVVCSQRYVAVQLVFSVL